ncbi:glucose 1-dehydrogenase [Candidatus Micrarchaeota archaeon]|jgi:3-oxoacyl-[acyl-carrier protein] reductase|nr:glucose 1-dehydrogenase [Candidatus Micrarchaeota archaeon]
MKLKNKIAIITGASRGIGKSTALLFAKEGARVAVNYHISDIEPNAEENAFSIVDEIKKIGSDAIAIGCDVSKENDVKEMVQKTIDAFGKIDILVNNAGVVFDVPLFEKTVEQWEQTLNVNLIGTFLCSKYASEQMLKNGNGKIINISSTNGINSFSPESADYDASKAGIINLTYNLAKELAPQIQVNSVAPGWVDTDMNKYLPKDFVDEEIKKIYLKRFAKPEEIAKAILFLASDDASYITGSILKVDGGYD